MNFHLPELGEQIRVFRVDGPQLKVAVVEATVEKRLESLRACGHKHHQMTSSLLQSQLKFMFNNPTNLLHGPHADLF